MGRYQITETVRVYGWLPAGSDAVEIVLWKDGAELSGPVGEGGNGELTDDDCTEEGTDSGLYYWETSKLTTQPSSYATYAYKMTEAYTGHTFCGKFVVGWPTVSAGGGGATYISQAIAGGEAEIDESELRKIRMEVSEIRNIVKRREEIIESERLKP